MNWQLILKTAIRDSRRDRMKLLLFMTSILLGVAALVAINSFNSNVSRDIDLQAKSLLGADLSVTSNKPIDGDLITSLDSLGGEVATEAEIFSMSYIPKTDQTQFVKIKGIEGKFPFYGKLLSIPSSASSGYQYDNTALVDDGMMLQYGLEVGDSIKLGDTYVVIAGRLTNAFGSVDVGSSFAPTIYISYKSLQDTKLIQVGSFVNYARYLKLDPDFDIQSWKDTHRNQFRNNSIRLQTVEDRKENLKEAFGNLNRFLNIVALISLLLACIGVASSVMIYLKTKVQSIAIMRCMGMKGKEAFLVYFTQVFVLGVLAVLAGALLGSGIQVLLPIILEGFLPFEVNMTVSWDAFAKGVLMGTLVTILFALSPLLGIRNISPLQTIRQEDNTNLKDRWQWLVYLGIFLAIYGYLRTIVDTSLEAILGTSGLAVAVLILFGVAKIVTWAARKFLPKNAPFVVRQGISNLYRPNNQTQLLIVSLGLGSGILTMLFVLQGLILKNVDSMDAGNQPNMILFGIESNQESELKEITQSYDLPIIQYVPVVTMEVAGWKGKSKVEWLKDTTRTASRWAINREARVSYQSEMNKDDELVEGNFVGQYSGGDSIYISLDERYAEGLDVGIGDDITWNVQGAMIKTFVGSIRKINFRKLESRFFILFPLGVLEQAPQFSILVTKSPDKSTTAAYRNEVVKQMPNISAVDLGNILTTLNGIISKVAYVIKFMAGFSIIIGLLVLISSLFMSKYQRIKESVLLRTIGATTRKIFQINAIEYFAIGLLSALTGILIALISSFLLAKFVFELDFSFPILPISFIIIFIVILTMFIGLWNNKEVIQKSPLEVLRKV